MPFYTLAFWRGANRNFDQVRVGNYLIVTPDRDAANLLYRFIQDEHKAIQIKRASPQYWTFHGDLDIRTIFHGILCGWITINNKKFESVRDSFSFHQFQSNDFSSGLPSLPKIPHIDAPDHISGTEVYIRSKHMPDQYWYLNVNNVDVELSEDKRTKFRIEYAKNPSDRETLLINDDDVVISAVYGDETIIIDLDRDGQVVASYGGQANFKFRALLHGGFDINVLRVGYSILIYNEARCTYGEEWELV